MGQLKEKLAPVITHGFWICTGLVLLGSVVVWFLSTSTLTSETDARITKLNSDVSKVTAVRSALSTHPNPTSIEKLGEIVDGRTAEVLQAWQQVFEKQQRILTWPEEVLKKDFMARFGDKIPVENDVPYPPDPDNPVPTELLNRYSQYIKAVLPDLAAIVDAEWTADFEQAAGGGGYGEGYGGDDSGGMMYGSASNVDITGIEAKPLVDWPTAAQQTVLKDLFPWRPNRPTELEVHYSQENIWILRQLLQIISNVNGDAKQSFQAKIRVINEIGIGEEVDFETGEVADVGDLVTVASGGGYGDMGGYMEGEDPYGDMGGYGDMGAGGMAGAAISPDPAENRYLDMQNQPLAAATLRAALKSRKPEDAALAVAKRVPVKVSVVMDQRAVPTLLAECGSAPLMVEVSQVRILPEDVSAAAGGGDDEMGYGDDMGSGGYGGEEDMYGGGPVVPTVPVDETPFDVTVEVFGVIHIYNKPNEEALGLDQVDENTVIDGSDKVDEPAVPATAPGDNAPAENAPADQAPTTDAPAVPDDPAAGTDPATGTDPAANGQPGGNGNPSAPVADPVTTPAAPDLNAQPAAATGAAGQPGAVAPTAAN